MARFKTTLLLGGLTALVLAVGYYFGGQQGALIALVLSAVMNFGSYWFSDKIVLKLYGAKEIPIQENPKLHAMVEELAQKANLPKPKICLVALPIPNAFATGRNEKYAVVAVTNGILQLLSENELRGVLAHELSHIKNRDILVSSIAATLAGAISYLAQMMYFAGMFAGNRSSDDSRDGGNAFGALALLILTPIIATLLHLAVSRSREYLADETGARISKDPSSLASALEKLHRHSRARPLIGEPKYEATAHLFIVNPFKPSLLMSLFSTHPPVEERVKKLKALNMP
jgi:heat shock protein HtpX